MRGLTDRQSRVLGILKRAHRRGLGAPSYRELASELGVSVRAAWQHVRALECKGFLARRRGRIELAPEHRPPRGVPVLGRVAAGSPILATENVEEHVDLAAELGAPGAGGSVAGGSSSDDDLFLLRVRGDSMTGAGILDGDLVLVRACPEVRDGEIAVVVIGTEATVKRVRTVGGRVRFLPENPDFREVVPEPGEDVRVAGRVLMAVRRV